MNSGSIFSLHCSRKKLVLQIFFFFQNFLPQSKIFLTWPEIIFLSHRVFIWLKKWNIIDSKVEGLGGKGYGGGRGGGERGGGVRDRGKWFRIKFNKKKKIFCEKEKKSRRYKLLYYLLYYSFWISIYFFFKSGRFGSRFFSILHSLFKKKTFSKLFLNFLKTFLKLFLNLTANQSQKFSFSKNSATDYLSKVYLLLIEGLFIIYWSVKFAVFSHGPQKIWRKSPRTSQAPGG